MTALTATLANSRITWLRVSSVPGVSEVAFAVALALDALLMGLEREAMEEEEKEEEEGANLRVDDASDVDERWMVVELVALIRAGLVEEGTAFSDDIVIFGFCTIWPP